MHIASAPGYGPGSALKSYKKAVEGAERGWQQDNAACKTWDASGASANLMAAVCRADAKIGARSDTWKELQSPKVWRHGKGNKKTNWCWGQVNKKGALSIHLHCRVLCTSVAEHFMCCSPSHSRSFAMLSGSLD